MTSIDRFVESIVQNEMIKNEISKQLQTQLQTQNIINYNNSIKINDLRKKITTQIYNYYRITLRSDNLIYKLNPDNNFENLESLIRSLEKELVHYRSMNSLIEFNYYETSSYIDKKNFDSSNEKIQLIENQLLILRNEFRDNLKIFSIYDNHLLTNYLKYVDILNNFETELNKLFVLTDTLCRTNDKIYECVEIIRENKYNYDLYKQILQDESLIHNKMLTTIDNPVRQSHNKYIAYYNFYQDLMINKNKLETEIDKLRSLLLILKKNILSN